MLYSLTEFNLIKKFFADKAFAKVPAGSLLQLTKGIGDDAAILEIPQDFELVVTTDTSVNNIHFLETTEPADIAYRAVAVSLSDLAAMGAMPYGFLLNLTLPEAKEAWLTGFSAGLEQITKDHQLTLIGGDTTHGPLSITVTHLGIAQKNTALRRSGAKQGDLIVVSGTLGDAAAGLQCLQRQILHQKFLIARYLRPTIRCRLGEALRGIATAAIDISDGLLADLQHILEQSGVGANIHFSDIPLSKELVMFYDRETARSVAISHGDDYELCFTIAPSHREYLVKIATKLEVPLTIIGEITSDCGELQCLDEEGNSIHLNNQGYQHFHDN